MDGERFISHLQVRLSHQYGKIEADIWFAFSFFRLEATGTHSSPKLRSSILLYVAHRLRIDTWSLRLSV